MYDIKNLVRLLVLPSRWAGIKDVGAKRVVKPEFNKAATKCGSRCGAPEQESAIVVVDDTTLKLSGDQGSAPDHATGHFNVYNTHNDVY